MRGVAHRGDGCRSFINLQTKSLPSLPLRSRYPTRGAEGGCWSDARNVGRAPQLRVLSWGSLPSLCMCEWVDRWEAGCQPGPCLPRPLLASVDTMRARGQTSLLCRIKGRHEALRQSLFWPVTELACGWEKGLRGTLFFFFPL